MRILKKCTACALALMMTLSGINLSGNSWATGSPQPQPEPVRITNFKDVPATHYAAEAIKTMSSLGIITGYPDGTFKPEAEVRRVEFATMMVKALRLEVNKTNKTAFVDMGREAWAIPYVEAAKPYLTGYKSSAGLTFKPMEASVREDMAVALVKALKYSVTSGQSLSVYADADQISTDLKPYVSAAIDKKLMIGSSVEGKMYFSPQKTLTRAEAAQLLMNVIKEEKITFDDDVKTEEKIVLDENKPAEPSDDDEKDKAATEKSLFVKATRVGSSIKLEWTEAVRSGFQGYKVVASLEDSSPKYPDNGYAYYITDIDDNEAYLRSGNGYNGGDFEVFKTGKTYYVSITYLYENGKRYTNVIRVTL